MINAGDPIESDTNPPSDFAPDASRGEPALEADFDESFLQRRSGVIRRPPPTKFGAIDIGTNSIHMIMVEITPEGDFRILGRDKEMVQLGKGGFQKHLLTPPAMDAGIAALTRFQKMARLKGIASLRAVATSAVREAHNGGDFVERARGELGLDVHVLSVEDEARLIYLAVRHAVKLGEEDDLICDIGGGSVEVIVGNARRPLVLFSSKLGGLRLAELFLQTDPPPLGEIKSMRRQIQKSLSPLEQRVGRRRFGRCICTSGSFECIARICQGRRGMQVSDGQVQMRVSRAELKALLSDLSGTSREQRLKIPGMDAKRVDTLIPAATTLMTIGRMFEVQIFEFCDMALREGLIIDHIAQSRAHLLARATWPDPRIRSVIQLAERCGYHRAHAEQVQRLALSLFDQLNPLHGLDRRYRELLGFACLLHDVGYLIGHSGHHKHSYYLIRNGGLQGFGDMEIELIANLARYHRKGKPRKSDYSYCHLDRQSRRAFKKLIPVLRLANALDRTHYSVVQSVVCRLLGDRVDLQVNSERDCELEVWTARREKEHFEREYGIAMKICPPGEESVKNGAE
ncbi:MAG: hypothetical protein DCC65_14835 [Planctomycetota bacterium]|nr:MAG: hypothetical protein DCC65_14835 [Planctomycetota bacterium]